MDYKKVNDYEIVYLVKENDDEALEFLFKKYQPVMLQLATKYYYKYKYIGISLDDLLQECRVGLMNALYNFNDDQSMFYSFANLCIERSLINYCRSYNTLKNFPLNYSLYSGVNEYREIACRDNIDIILIENERFFECKCLLNFKQSVVFELRYNGFTYNEIASLLNLPRSTVDGRITLIRKKLKDNLNFNF